MAFFRVPRLLTAVWRTRVWRLDQTKGAVYLTFDDGPIPEATPWVLDQLKVHGIKASFFCVGENVRRNEGIFQRILQEGHSVGNHTMRHENGAKTDVPTYLKAVSEASQYIESDLFRPPYGRLTSRQSRHLRKKYRIIMWSWLSHDYDPEIPVDKILQKAQKEIRPGDVIVLHDNVKSFERLQLILPELIVIVKKKGLRFLPIE